jgi:ribosomal protein S18 acetylase RimI-like enzyme
MKIILSDKEEVQLRGGQSEDALFCYDLIQENMNRYNPSPKTFNQYESEFISQDVYVLYKEEEKVGFLEFQEKKDAWHLWDMQISLSMQGRGLGTKLLRFMEDEIRSKGGNRILLNVYKSNPAVKLYERNGYKINEGNGDRYAMSKDLV